MKASTKISGLAQLGQWINHFLNTEEAQYTADEQRFSEVLKRSEIENAWFTPESLRWALQQWAKLLTEDQLQEWVSAYPTIDQPKRVGLILAGNIPLVGFHDIISVVLSGHTPIIKCSSKDQRLIPYLMERWAAFCGGDLEYTLVERMENYDAIIATGSNNTARYLEYYFKKVPHIIRKNRTSVAVLRGDETDEELQRLAQDIFIYYGLGCRNVTRLFIPQDFKLDRLFENFFGFKDIIHHHQYANNYDYNKAVYLLNQEVFWDNNFVMLKEDERLFSPLAVIHFSRYERLEDALTAIDAHKEEIQCVVAAPRLGLGESVDFGQAQQPDLKTYADNVDTMKFLTSI